MFNNLRLSYFNKNYASLQNIDYEQGTATEKWQ